MNRLLSLWKEADPGIAEVEDAMLRLAKKYSMSPIVIERAMHKLGRLGTEKISVE